ncbi:nuclear transport factor 2 family protein [Novosphingobium colocasiae]
MNIDSLIDMELIRQSLASYARGIDRQDLELVLGAYWPDGWDAHGTHEGTPAEFGAFVSRQWPMLRMQHLLGQSHIELDGKFANVETYFFAHQHLVEGGSEWVIAGRYDDRFEKAWRRLESPAPGRGLRLAQGMGFERSRCGKARRSPQSQSRCHTLRLFVGPVRIKTAKKRPAG